MTEHNGRWFIAYSWYVAACAFCVAGGFLAGWLAR
jgi:hypothetical protein